MRILNVLNLGVVDYKKLREVQDEYNRRLIETGEETLIVAECKPHIDFGSNVKKNIFSDPILKKLAEYIGESPYVASNSGELTKKAHEYLIKNGIDGLTFSITNRGGGSTVLAPGQSLYFCAIDVSKSVNQQDRYKSMSPLIVGINEVMHNAIRKYVSDAHLHEMNYSDVLQSPNYDVGVIRDGKPYKLGSKGVSVYEDSGRIVSRGGFSIHLHPDGNKFSHYVHACGINPNEMGITSLNEVTRSIISPKDLSTSVVEEFVKKFRFDGYSLKK